MSVNTVINSVNVIQAYVEHGFKKNSYLHLVCLLCFLCLFLSLFLFLFFILFNCLIRILQWSLLN